MAAVALDGDPVLSPTGWLHPEPAALEGSSGEGPGGAALQSVLAQRAQKKHVSSSCEFTAAPQSCLQRSPARLGLRYGLCVLPGMPEEQVRQEEGPLSCHVTPPRLGCAGPRKGASCRTMADGEQTAALNHSPSTARSPAPSLPAPSSAALTCTWRMGSGIRYLQQDLTRRTAVSRHTLWPTET